MKRILPFVLVLFGAAVGYASSFARNLTLSKSYANTVPTISQIWERVDTAMCPDAEAALGLAPGACTIEEGTVVSFTRGATETDVSVTFTFAGQWTKN